MVKRTANDVIKRALGEIGVAEKPAGSNNVKYAELYGMNRQPWCAMFVWWAINYGAEAIIPKTAYTPTLWNWAKKEGILRDPDYLAKAGDIVLFQFPNLDRINHVGIVVKDRMSASEALVCVEGNTGGTNPRDGGMVAATKRKSYIRGIIDMSGRYAKPTVATKPKATPNPSPKPAYAITRLLRIGSEGNDVKALQRALGVADDGKFGAKTHAAVIKFQKSKKLDSDGVVGAATSKALGWTFAPATNTAAKGFKVRVTGARVIIRAGAGTNYKDTGKRVKRGEVHTIIAERKGRGANTWGQLKNGSGWISLDFTTRRV